MSAPNQTAAQLTPVDAALCYADYAARRPTDATLWHRQWPKPSKGDIIIGRGETDLRSERCLQILAAEVRSLRAAAQAVVARIDEPGASIHSVRWQDIAALRAALKGGQS